MSSIPLPALDIRPPQQQENPVDQYARLMQIKQQMANAPLQTQALQNQVQAGNLENQKAQIQLKDQQAMNAAMQQWAQPKSPAATPQTTSTLPRASALPSGAATPSATPAPSSLPNYDDLIDLAKKNGASFSAIQGLQSSVLAMKEKASTIAKDDAQTGNDNANAMKTKNGMIIDAMSGVMNLPDQQIVPGLMSAAQELAAKGILDPQHVQQAQQLAQLGDPAKIRQSLQTQITGMGGFNKLLEDAQKKTQNEQEAGKSDPNSPFYAPSQQAVALGTVQGAKQIQQNEVSQGARRAAADAAARQPFEMSLAHQRQALSQGDPSAAGQLLVDGDATLSQLKARGSTPEFIQQALNAAHQLSGGKYNAQQAEAQFDVAKSPANTAFFGSSKSLTDPGGTLDQLATVGKTIPQNQIPAFNKVEDWTKAATGSGPIAGYAATVLGVADDYGKVMGGGQSSDTARTQALNLINAAKSPEQRAAAIDSIRNAVKSQTVSRIGKNSIMQKMYGDETAPMAPSAGSDPFAQFGGKAH